MPNEAQIAEEIEELVRKNYPGPHRCNPRVDDWWQGFFRVPPSTKGTFSTFVRCMVSKPGEEPTRPFVYLNKEEYEKEVVRKVEEYKQRLRELFRKKYY